MAYRKIKNYSTTDVASNAGDSFVSNREYELARYIVEKTDRNLLIVGRAGTGKTMFLNRMVAGNPRYMVLAPSGIAALEAGGQTIHSFFKFDTLPYKPETDD